MAARMRKIVGLFLFLGFAVGGAEAKSYVDPRPNFYSLRRPIIPVPDVDPFDPDPQGGTPQGAYGPSSGSAAAGGGLDQTVNPLSFGAKWDVKFEGDCTFVNTSQTVTCAGGNFTGADVGKIEFGTAGSTRVDTTMLTAAGLAVPQGTITGFTNSTTVTVSLAATSGCTPSSTVSCIFAWGTQDDTTALNNAMTAAWNTTGARCVLQLPAGVAFFSGPIFSGPANNECGGSSPNTGVMADLSSTGPVVYGQGPGATVLVPLPTFNFAGCTNGSGATCVGGTGNLHAHDFGINGLQQSQPANSNSGVVLFEAIGQNGGGFCDGGTTTWNLALSGWGLKSTTSIGFKFGVNMCNDSTMWNINVSAFGNNPCHASINGNVLNAYGLFCFGASGTSAAGNVLDIDGTGAFSNGVFNSFGGQYLSALSTATAELHVFATGNGVTFNSWGDLFGFGGGTVPAQNSALIANGQSATFNFHNSNLFVPSGTTGASQVIFLSGTNVIHADHTIFNANGGANNHILTSSATDKFFDDGGNSYTAGGAANAISGPFFGPTASATGSVCATGNFALTSGWGTSSITSVAANGDTRGCHVTITGAAGAASPVLTWTYPTAPIVAPSSCHLSGASGTLTGVSTGTPGATNVAYTFTGTPSAQTYVFDVGCP
jgi:hypothetical protein